ncbi:HalOD1 output domain-containing protein [Halobiforma nitratireducens]|uniref:HalOD1 output domain-containing protein n=1 Tax=Halobiforma nitratireducens TaxID=130048 RepID=UPI00373AF315
MVTALDRIAAHEGSDPTALPPLYETVDTVALIPCSSSPPPSPSGPSTPATRS